MISFHIYASLFNFLILIFNSTFRLNWSFCSSPVHRVAIILSISGSKFCPCRSR